MFKYYSLYPVDSISSLSSAFAEFYIPSDYQIQGLGRALAEHAFSKQPGLWEVRVAIKNTSGYDFWVKTISNYTSNRYTLMKNESYDGCGIVFQSTESNHTI